MLLSQQVLLDFFLVFCRVGTAAMLLPGFSTSRAPVMFRLLLALCLSASIYAFVAGKMPVGVGDTALTERLVSEIFFGLLFGFLCASFVLAARFSATLILNLIGLAGIPGQPMEDADPNPALVTFWSIATTVLIFTTGLHLLTLEALLETYDSFPVGSGLEVQLGLDLVTRTLRDTFLLALQTASPFILFSLAVNFALGLVGKLTPQLQAYFAFMGITTVLALVVLWLVGSTLLSFFVSSYAQWIQTGL